MTAPARTSDQRRLAALEGERAAELRRLLVASRTDPSAGDRRRVAALRRELRLSTRSAPARLDLPVTLLGRDGRTATDVRAAAAGDGSGHFEGYAVLWDVVDAYGTRFAPGTFTAGGLDEDLYALLWMHDPASVVGTFAAREDDRGMWIEGGWDPTPEGGSARARAASGSAGGLSVGFVPMMLDPDDDTRFTQARLVEVSQITARMAAVPGAGFSAVRSTLVRGVPGQETEPPPPSDDTAGAAAVAAALLALAGTRAQGGRRG